jgi:hypothetical protein
MVMTCAWDVSWRHDIGTIEQLFRVTCEASQLEQSLRTTSGEPDSHDFIRVTAKAANILLRPEESLLNIPNSSVGSSTLVQQGRAISQASHTESVIVRNKDEVGGQIEEAFWGVLRLAA